MSGCTLLGPSHFSFVAYSSFCVVPMRPPDDLEVACLGDSERNRLASRVLLRNASWHATADTDRSVWPTPRMLSGHPLPCTRDYGSRYSPSMRLGGGGWLVRCGSFVRCATPLVSMMEHNWETPPSASGRYQPLRMVLSSDQPFCVQHFKDGPRDAEDMEIIVTPCSTPRARSRASSKICGPAA